MPEYRVPAASVLPRIGLVGASWRPLLTATLPARLGDGLVVDLRSSDYAAMWRAPKTLDVVSVRILTEMPDGRLMVVSYVSQAGQGPTGPGAGRPGRGRRAGRPGPQTWSGPGSRAGSDCRHPRTQAGTSHGCELITAPIGLTVLPRGSARAAPAGSRPPRHHVASPPDRHPEQERGQRRRRPGHRVRRVTGHVEQFGP